VYVAEAPRDVIFREAQKPTQKWVWLLVTLMAGGIWIMTLIHFFFARPEHTSLSTDLIIVISWALAGVGIPILLLTMELVTEVRSDGLYVRMIPFHLKYKRFSWDEIRECQARKYDPIREYGGWGIRWGKGGRAYNMSGSRGVQLVLSDGRRLLIGSQRAEELAAFIQQARSKQSKRGQP
jgi:hypothetical protein